VENAIPPCVDAELRLAQAAGGYSTMKETVSVGLRELAAADARRREILRLTSGAMAEFADKSFREDAWR
jgi:hypothetical protein